MFKKFENLQLWLKRRLGRWMVVFPLLSTGWGIASGITVSRDYEKSRYLVGYLAALVLLSVLLRLWLDRQAFWLAESEEPVDPPKGPRARLKASLKKRPELVEVPTLQVTQYCAQYIVTFSLPLLYTAHAWTTLILVTVLAATTLWDQWWGFLIRRSWYRSLIRLLSTVLAVAFVYPVFLPQELDLFHPTLGILALLSVLPWDLVTRKRTIRRRDWFPSLGVGGLILAQSVLGAATWFPMLSVWIKSPALGFGIENRVLHEEIGSQVSRDRLLAGLASPEGLCCLTPVKGPSGISSTLVHEWRVNGRLVDKILLPPVLGTGHSPSEYRTYSCKHYFPNRAEITSISCLAYLEGHHLLSEVEIAVTEAVKK
jgi:hypothetical protein